MKKPSIVRIVLVAELFLIIPLIAMQFTSEVDWDLRDFIVASILLAGIGYAYQRIVSGLSGKPRRVVFGILIAIFIIIAWVELAVGILGTPFAGS